MPHLPHLQRPGGSGGDKSKGAHTMKGTWQHISIPPLPRSSHSIDVVAGNAYIFGGEAESSRKPVDNDMHIIVLPTGSASADYFSVKAKPSPEQHVPEPAPITEEDEIAAELKPPNRSKTNSLGDVPSARVGHASAVIGSRIFLFGGRSAESASEPLDEHGRVWVFETKTHTWAYLDPYHNSPVPSPRSFFAAVATDKPRDFAIKPLRRTESWKEWAEGDSVDVGIPQRPIAGNVAAHAVDEEDAGFGTFIIHGGCTADGGRTGDVWAFDVRSRTWKELPSAPGPARGGAALALAKSRLYRFGGYDGEKELGGQLDVLDLVLDEFDDRVSRGEIGIFARGEWQTLAPPVTNAPLQVITKRPSWYLQKSGPGTAASAAWNSYSAAVDASTSSSC
ncbi:putative kelch domain-containing protein [Daldinia childiae]|uniref:putative kelch domain-containing protein n=1 Tax=Daldinia childiae TaxID=326645 RepID=UPI001446CAE3|nr:putative kelch domain-containing protein [Daldinia childiae]KAF3058424.1 putative kelch domain-containing protein [Daldinia childiae]